MELRTRWVHEDRGNYYYDATTNPHLLIQTWRADFAVFDESNTPPISNIYLENPILTIGGMCFVMEF
jgi:hypothetical protein